MPKWEELQQGQRDLVLSGLRAMRTQALATAAKVGQEQRGKLPDDIVDRIVLFMAAGAETAIDAALERLGAA